MEKAKIDDNTVSDLSLLLKFRRDPFISISWLARTQILTCEALSNRPGRRGCHARRLIARVCWLRMASGCWFAMEDADPSPSAKKDRRALQTTTTPLDPAAATILSSTSSFFLLLGVPTGSVSSSSITISGVLASSPLLLYRCGLLHATSVMTTLTLLMLDW